VASAGRGTVDEPPRTLRLEIGRDGQPRVSVGGQAPEMTDEERAALAERVQSPEFQAAWKRFQEVMARGEPDVALVPTPLLEGAIAKVIVDPLAEHQRLIVVREAGLDDVALDLARKELTRWELRPESDGQAVEITVWADGRVRRESGGNVVEFKPDGFSWHGPDRHVATRELLGRAKSAEYAKDVTHPKLGSVRVVAPLRRG
jgi:hypothetical protein